MNILKEIKTFFSSQKEKTIIPFGEKGKGNSFDPKNSPEEYKKAISSLSLEYPDILKKMENDGGKQILSDFQDKVILSWKLIQEAFEKKGEPDFDISIDSFYKDVISDRFNVLTQLGDLYAKGEAQENLELEEVKIYNTTEEFNPYEYFLNEDMLDMYDDLSAYHYYKKEQEDVNEVWDKIYEVKYENDLIADTTEYKIAVSTISLEYQEILNIIEQGGKEDELMIDFQDKFVDTLQKLGMTNYENAIESYFKDVVYDRFNVLKAQENIAQKIDVYNVNKEGYVSFETVQKPLEIGDKINLLTKSGDLYTKGEVKNINNGEIELNTTKGIVRAPFDARIEPLFLSDSQNKKIHIEYGVNETITLLDQRKLGMHENYFANRMDDFTNLLKGNEKEEGKLQIIKNVEGKPVVSLELKKPKLNIDAAYIQYGTDHFKLNQEQKEQLKKTGELGLVNLTSNVTNKESKLWVSIDKELNSIVTQKSEAIAINKIFGTSTTEEQKNKLKSGEGVLLDIKGKNYFIIASAASKNSDGLRIFHETKARELNLIPNKNLDQFDVKKTGIKI